jgi:hypothetical protein
LFTRHTAEYIVDATIDVVDASLDKWQRGKRTSQNTRSNFWTFVVNVINRAEVSMSVLLVTLVYIKRSEPFLKIMEEAWALERVFVGAVVVASKVGSPSSFENRMF